MRKWVKCENVLMTSPRLWVGGGEWLEEQKLQQILLHDSEEKERDRKQAAKFQNQKLQLEELKLELSSDDKSKDRDFQENKFDALARLAQEILEQSQGEVSLDDMSISALLRASDIFLSSTASSVWRLATSVQSWGRNTQMYKIISSQEYREKLKSKLLRFLTKSRSWKSIRYTLDKKSHKRNMI